MALLRAPITSAAAAFKELGVFTTELGTLSGWTRLAPANLDFVLSEKLLLPASDVNFLERISAYVKTACWLVSTVRTHRLPTVTIGEFAAFKSCTLRRSVVESLYYCCFTQRFYYNNPPAHVNCVASFFNAKDMR